MNLYTRAGNRKRFRRIVHLRLQFLKHSVEDAILCPATHPLVNGIPSAKLRREASPFATVLRHVQNGVKHLPVKNSHISSLSRQIRRDTLISVFWQLHKFKKNAEPKLDGCESNNEQQNYGVQPSSSGNTGFNSDIDWH